MTVDLGKLLSWSHSGARGIERDDTREPVSNIRLICSESTEEGKPTFITVPFSEVLYVLSYFYVLSTAVINSLIK